MVNRREDNLHNEVALLTGTVSADLATKVSNRMRQHLTRTLVGEFSDGEVMVQIKENVRGRNIFVIQSICCDVNRSLMELLLIVDAARRSSADEIIAVIPYLGYARQDRRPQSDRVPISARVVADMLCGAGVTRLVTIDVHSEQIQGFYNIPVDNVYATPVLIGDIVRNSRKMDNLMIVSPDVGGIARARAFATGLEVDLAIIDKRRPAANESRIMHMIGDVKGRNCILIDDIVDTAGSLCSAAQTLTEFGAESVRAYCTHAILSGDAINRIKESLIEELVVSDTIPLSESAAECSKIRALSVSELLAETLVRIHSQESVSSLFIE